jgi:tetratricopeptide (TPR) repeat protein
MTFAVVLAAMVLAGVAAAGVLRPFGSSRQVGLERLADPLEDERLSLLRALRDLEEEHVTGELAEGTYLALRAETETRAVAVLRALEARDGAGELSVALKEVRGLRRGTPPRPATGAETVPGSGRNGHEPQEPTPRRPRALAPTLIGLVAVALVVPLLITAVRNRAPGAPVSGSIPAPSAGDPFSFFEQRVADHPNDLAARLDLAQRYLAAGDAKGAIPQYLAALKLDPKNVEAHAELGFLIFRAGKTDDALLFEEQALAVDPAYPEALYFKGVILLVGKKQPEPAAAAFRSYLQAAPYGAHVAEVRRLLQQAEATPSPSVSPSS